MDKILCTLLCMLLSYSYSSGQEENTDMVDMVNIEYYKRPSPYLRKKKDIMRNFWGITYEDCLEKKLYYHDTLRIQDSLRYERVKEEEYEQIKRGKYIYYVYTNENYVKYDKKYADKLKKIYGMIGDDIYLMLSMAFLRRKDVPMRLWIIQFKSKRGAMPSGVQLPSPPPPGITIAVEHEALIKLARDIRILE